MKNKYVTPVLELLEAESGSVFCNVSGNNEPFTDRNGGAFDF